MELPETEQFRSSFHVWSESEIDAVTLALAAERPLLVQGEPGTGKTQLARAAATALGWMLHSETIHARFEPHELRYRFDAVKRLADAQVQDRKAVGDAKNYWSPGVLWRAYGWASAKTYIHAESSDGDDPSGHVVLIDEIDKADSDLPNSLLDVLAQRSFSIEPLGLTVGGPDARVPLIVVTTNRERDVPAAFLRRCVVLTQAAKGDYREWLLSRARAHFGEKAARADWLDERVMEAAAEQLIRDRDELQKLDLSPPGLAEYLDLLHAVNRLIPASDDIDPESRCKLQEGWINRLSAFSFLKHAVDDKVAPAAHQPAEAERRRSEDLPGQSGQA